MFRFGAINGAGEKAYQRKISESRPWERMSWERIKLATGMVRPPSAWARLGTSRESHAELTGPE